MLACMNPTGASTTTSSSTFSQPGPSSNPKQSYFLGARRERRRLYASVYIKHIAAAALLTDASSGAAEVMSSLLAVCWDVVSK